MSSPLSDPASSAEVSAAAPAAPNLVLVRTPSTDTSVVAAANDGDISVLGLSLKLRMQLAARRARYGRVFYLTPDGAAPPGVTPVTDWSALDATLGTKQPASLLIAPVTILGESEWLERLASAPVEGGAWAAAPGRLIMLPAQLVPAALEAVAAAEMAGDIAATQGLLTRRFGAPATLPPGVDPLVVAAPSDVRAAERRLLRNLVKDTDGFMARHFERPISLAISRLLASSRLTPNQVTLISIVIGLIAAPFFIPAQPSWQTAGGLSLLTHSILDGCDGELARLKFQESRWGGILDFWGDNVVHVAVFACMAVGWWRSDGGMLPVLLGVAATLGTLGSASFVYWRVIRPKHDAGPLYTSVSSAPGRPLTRLLDALSRRDFIYLIILLALFGEAAWFLLLTAVGAPLFFFLLLLVAAREQSPRLSQHADA